MTSPVGPLPVAPPPGSQVISDVAAHIRPVVIAVLVVSFVVALGGQLFVQARCRWRGEEPPAGSKGVLVATLLAPMLVIPGVNLLTSAAAPQAASDPVQVPDAPPAPQAPAADGSVHVPWATIGLVVGAMAAFVVLVALVTVASKRYRARRRRSAMVSRHVESLRGRQATVLQAWAAIETNLLEVFALPHLTDVSVPETGRFFSAMDEAERRQVLLGARDVDLDAAIDGYDRAVRELEDTWRVALAHARRVGHSFLPEPERRRVSKAISLLRTAADPSAFPAERQACYATALQLVRGLITVPRQAALALERSTRLALTARGAAS